MNRSEIDSVLPEGDALLVVPPFAATNLACLGVHLLQACAREAGFSVGVFYASLAFASRVGEGAYVGVAGARYRYLGEKAFAPAAYGTAPFGEADERDWYAGVLEGIAASSKMPEAHDVSAVLQEILYRHPCTRPSQLKRVEAEAGPWADDVAQAIAARGYRVVGCTTMFEQTAASIALLDRVKRLRPDIVTIIGGANCEGEMAKGIASLRAGIDVIFSGDSEASFTAFLDSVMKGEPLPGPVVEGGTCVDLEALPRPDFAEFFDQREQLLPRSAIPKSKLMVPYETGRGCWWVERRKCKFCGFNGRRTRYLSKSPDTIVRDLRTILSGRPSRKVRMVDNVPPRAPLSELMGKLKKAIPSLEMIYEVRSDLSLRDVMAMKRAGVVSVEAGIESLSNSLLRRMGKGVSVRDNIALLRYARSAGLTVYWGVLWGFPGDDVAEYEEMIGLIPLLRHLQPVWHFTPLSLERFSTYFEQAQEHGISNVRPQSAYARFLPPHADMSKLDYHFAGDFECGAFSRLDVIRRLADAIRGWQRRWEDSGTELFGGPPRLEIVRESADRYRLTDTRGLPGAENGSVLSPRQAAYALVARPIDDTPEARWARRQRLAVARGHWLVPLATADPELLLAFEDGVSQTDSDATC